MRPKILVVEDSLNILFNLKLTLEINNYEVITATNGKEGIHLLSKMAFLPNLIISDILMPVMDGYEFFENITGNPHWGFIPFIFLTAKAEPEDIRLGRILGADDYITKPYNEEDLLAIIKGKIKRSKERELIRRNIEERILTMQKDDTRLSITEEEKQAISTLFLIWDEVEGPELVDSYPLDPPYESERFFDIGIQLFQASVSIFGQHGDLGSAGILLTVKNIGKDGYIYFDIKRDEEVRGGERLFMLAVLAPKISYLKSLEINELLQKTSAKIKKSLKWSLSKIWTQVSEILIA